MPLLQLRIPKERRSGFAKLLVLDEPAFQELLAVLEEAPLTFGNNQLMSKLAPTLSTRAAISESDANEILRSILPLYALRFEGPKSTAIDFAEEICVALEKNVRTDTTRTDIDMTGQNREILKDRLVKLLSINAISTVLKATSVLIDHEHIFHSARLFTDIRPVFGDNPRGKPAAAVIVNMLRITYVKGREQKEFFVALD